MWTELIDGSVSVHRIKSSLTAKKLFVPAPTWNKFILVLRNNFRLFDMPEHKNSFILKANQMHKHTAITIKTLNLCLCCVLVRASLFAIELYWYVCVCVHQVSTRVVGIKCSLRVVSFIALEIYYRWHLVMQNMWTWVNRICVHVNQFNWRVLSYFWWRNLLLHFMCNYFFKWLIFYGNNVCIK